MQFGGSTTMGFNADVLDTIDLDSAFVTVDSNKINFTFKQIFKMLRAIGPNMEAFEKQLKDQNQTITKIQSDNERLDSTVQDVSTKVVTHDAKIQKLAETQQVHTNRLDALEKRIASQERINADLKDIGDTLSKMRADIRQLQDDSEGLGDTVRRHNDKLDANSQELKKSNDALNREKDRITAIYNVFEMDERKVLSANAQGAAAAASAANASGSSRRASSAAAGSALEAVNQAKVPHPPSSTAGGNSGGVSSPTGSFAHNQPTSAQAQYLLTLPAFTALRADFHASIGAAEARMADELEKGIAKLNGDISSLRGRLADKVDIRDYKPFETEVRDALKKLQTLLANYDKLLIELENKADKKDTENKLQHLMQTKADKSELLNMVTMDDIRALDKKIQDLSDAFDSLLGKINLELANLRNMRNVPSSNTTVVSGDGMDPSLPGRVLKLENETRDLYNIKADKFQVQEMLKNLDFRPMPQPLSARPATPPPVRPTSGSRAPNTPLQYTSTSPTRNPIISKGRYSVSAVLYDSDGNRTPASVTAARAVGNVVHLHNVARHAANPAGDIPHDHTVHVLP